MDILTIFQSPLFKNAFWDDDTFVVNMREVEGSQNLKPFAETAPQEVFLQILVWMEA